MGHIITKEGVKTDRSKVEAVQGFPVPTNEQEVRSFIGLCTYYRRFVKGFANIAGPLHALQRKDTEFIWTQECQKAFATLKSALTSAPCLEFPDMSQPFILTTDASGHALGYVLSQKDRKGYEHPIAFGGRSLRPLERKWSISERECLAIIQGIKEYHTYLADTTFTVVTDHSCLQWLKSIKVDSTRALVKKTQEPGIKLQKADFFRNDTWTSSQTNSEDAPKIPLVHFF